MDKWSWMIKLGVSLGFEGVDSVKILYSDIMLLGVLTRARGGKLKIERFRQLRNLSFID